MTQRTTTQIACDGIQRAWRTRPLDVPIAHSHTPSFDGVERVTVLRARPVVKTIDTQDHAVPARASLPVLHFAFRSMDGIRMPVLTH